MTHFCFVAVRDWWKRNHQIFSIHQTCVLGFSFQELEISKNRSNASADYTIHAGARHFALVNAANGAPLLLSPVRFSLLVLLVHQLVCRIRLRLEQGCDLNDISALGMLHHRQRKVRTKDTAIN